MKRFLIAVFVLASMVLMAGEERSPEWNKVRKAHLKKHPACALCGSKKDVQVHHIKPFHLHPELELEPSNLITSCTSKYWGFSCHVKVFHGGNFQYENPNVLEDIKNIQEIVRSTKNCFTDDICMENLDKELKAINKRTKKYNCETYGKCSKGK
jgi:hypothetical protein